MPKLLPTKPFHVHASPASLVHPAVAVAPTFKHVTEADTGAAAIAAWAMIKNFILFAAFLRDHVAHRVFRENTRLPHVAKRPGQISAPMVYKVLTSSSETDILGPRSGRKRLDHR